MYPLHHNKQQTANRIVKDEMLIVKKEKKMKCFGALKDLKYKQINYKVIIDHAESYNFGCVSEVI